MSGPAIRVEGLGKRYRLGAAAPYQTFREALLGAGRRLIDPRRPADEQEMWALRDLSFEVAPGEVLGVIGRNGAGKSTLLRLLSRIGEPTTGQAWVRGKLRALLEVGTGFHPELSGRENIFLNAAILGLRRREVLARLDEIVAFAEVARFLDTPVKHYSSGMYVRLAFAVAAHLEPDVLLVDEVLAVGDAAFQRKCLGKMGEAARGGRTLLFVSHNLEAIRSLCPRSLLLEEGRLGFDGPSAAAIDRYLRGAAAGLPGSLDTRGLARPEGLLPGAALRITRIAFAGAAAGAILVAGRPLELVLELECKRPLEEVVVAWSVHANESLRLFECRTGDAYGPLARVEPGRYRLACRLAANPLNPGLYALHVGARCASGGLDYLPAVMAFRVEGGAAVGSWWLEAPSGALRVASEWSRPQPIAAGEGATA